MDRGLLREIGHLLRPLATKLANVVGRGVVQRVNDGRKLQLVQLGVLATETVDGNGEGAEHFQPYGFASVPLAGAEGVVLFPNGDRGHPLAVVIADRKYRPTGGEPGQVTVHHYKGAKMTMLENGNVEVTPGPGGKIVFAGADTGPGLTSEGVVVGTGIDPFSGQTYNALGSASSNVFAKK